MTQLSNIPEYTTDIRRIAGKDNVVADTLSRAPVEDGPLLSPHLDVPNVAASFSVTAIEGIDFDDIACAQQTDAETLAICQDTAIASLRRVNREVATFHPSVLPSTSLLRSGPQPIASRHSGNKETSCGQVWPKIANDVT